MIECAKISLDSKEASSEEGNSSLSDHILRRPVDHSQSWSELSINGKMIYDLYLLNTNSVMSCVNVNIVYKSSHEFFILKIETKEFAYAGLHHKLFIKNKIIS